MLNSTRRMNTHLVVPDLFWPDQDTLSAADPGRLDALERLFARGRRAFGSATNLEAWLLQAWRASGGSAGYAFLADGGEPGEATWTRAAPCHLRVNRDRLVPVDATMFDVSRDEAEALAESLSRHFAHEGLVFYPMQPERWYVRGDLASDIDQLPLAVASGKPVAVRPSAGSGLVRWHALANELQMLLHQHPVNEAREARGELPLNALWLWGSGRFVPPPATPFRRVRADEPLAAGLARASGGVALPLPATAERWLRAAADEGVELVVLDPLNAPASYGDAAAWRERLLALERDWFAPLLTALKEGRIGMLTVHAIGANGTLDVETVRQDLRHFWRRPKPLPTYAAQ